MLGEGQNIYRGGAAMNYRSPWSKPKEEAARLGKEAAQQIVKKMGVELGLKKRLAKKGDEC